MSTEDFCVEAHTEGCSDNSASLLAEARNQCHSYPRSEARFHQDIKHCFVYQTTLPIDYADHVTTDVSIVY